jgi:hypothetical protein
MEHRFEEQQQQQQQRKHQQQQAGHRELQSLNFQGSNFIGFYCIHVTLYLLPAHMLLSAASDSILAS